MKPSLPLILTKSRELMLVAGLIPGGELYALKTGA
ncbi:MAG: hypothetical protein ACJA1W_001081 [Akkermansiaceae bacterium]|jgi:hypothetical protein